MEKIVEEHCYSENFMKLSSSEPVTEDGGSEDDGDDDDDMGSCALLQLDLTVLSVDLPEIQEVDTIAIAKNKALLAAQLADGPCLVEDTSLCFHALGGMPGPYIKWFHQTLKVEGTFIRPFVLCGRYYGCSSSVALACLRDTKQFYLTKPPSLLFQKGLYNILAAYPDKSATAVCTLAFSPEKHADPILFTGVCRGRIVPPEPGRGFGWDSIFIPDQADRPFSQMTLEEKNALSHRGAAVRQFADWLGHNQEALLARQNKKGVLGHQGLTFSMRPLKSTTLPGNEQ